jgi:hypothetical protein
VPPALPAGVLLRTDFAQGDTQGWELEQGWRMTPAAGLQGQEHIWARAGSPLWADYTVRMRLSIAQGGVHLNLRLSNQGRYYLGLWPGNRVYLARSLAGGPGGQFVHEELKQAPFRRLKSGAPTTVTAVVSGNTVRLYVDALLILEYADQQTAPPGRIGIEPLEGTKLLVSSVEVLQGAAPPRNATAWTIEERVGDLVLDGEQVLTIENKDLVQHGNIVLKGRARLSLRNAVVVVLPKDRPRADITMEGDAALEATDSMLLPGPDPSNLYVSASERAGITLTRSAFFNVLNVTGQARAAIAGSTLHSGVIGLSEQDGTFGIVQAGGQARVAIADSTVGSIALVFGPEASVALTGLQPGTYQRWSLGPPDGASFSLDLTNTTVLPSILVGGMERGWAVFADAASRITVWDSRLNKLVVGGIQKESVSFSGLQLNRPVDFSYKNIRLSNTSVFAQWGFITDSELTVTDSDGFWTFVFGSSTVRLVNTRMLEFDPREFTGVLEFVNARWCCAAEVIGDNAFVIRGTVTVTPELAQALVWFTSQVTREFPVQVVDAQSQPVAGARLHALRGGHPVEADANASGNAVLTLPFSDDSYKQPWTLTVTAPTGTATRTLDFFASTPLVIRVGATP